MAESTIAFLLDNLVGLAGAEAQRLRGGWEEITCLRSELERILAFLKDAEAAEETDEEVRTWLKQVRDVGHDAEDVVDEFVLLGSHDHGPGLYGCINKLCHCVRNVKASYRVASELRSVNCRIRRIFGARKRLAKKLDRALKISGTEWHDRRDDAVLLNNTDLVGVDEPKSQLVEFLLGGASDRRVAIIAGMGGIGKTAMAKKVFDDAKMKKHFKTRIWITVSQSSDQVQFLKNLIQSLRRSIPVDPNTDDMKMLIKSLLKNRRYLIVLDDVWHSHEWEAIDLALPNDQVGSRVILTTRRADVASSAEFYSLNPLSEAESWELFNRKTFRGKACPPYLFEICESILRKCEGLPLAIAALSSVLAMKKKRRIDEWDLIRRCLGSELHGNDRLEDLKRVLFLGFNDLPCHLKSCFLYLSVFPEGSIKRMSVVRLWISEGFVTAKNGRTLEEVAHDYLDELFNRSLIQVAEMKPDGRVKAYRVHGLLREIMVLKSRDQSFAALVNPESNQWPERSRRLSLHNVAPPVQKNRWAYRLRSFFMFGAVENMSLRLHFPTGFKLLRVLKVENVPLKIFPIEIVDLFYLKQLSLRKTKVRTIPRSIGKLKNLEILDLKHTFVSELPPDILKLQKLRHLLVYRFEPNTGYAIFDSKFGFKAIPGLGKLQALQHLCFVEASQVCGSTTRDLMSLTELRRLGIMRLRTQDGRALCASIERLTNLRVLSIKSVRENDAIDLESLSVPPRFIERLYLTGRLENMPRWIPSLNGIVKLFLKWSQLRDDPLVHLGDLPNLAHLELLRAYDGEALRFGTGKFPKLRLLGIDKFEELKSVDFMKGSVPHLERLIIQRCGLLRRAPSGVEYLTELKVVEFFDMPGELIGKVKGEAYWRFSGVQEVYFNFWRDTGWDVRSLKSFREREMRTETGAVTRRHLRRTLCKVEFVKKK